MNKEDLEECIEELYAIHKDLTDVHEDSVNKVLKITDSNKELLYKIEDLQGEIASSI